MTWNYRFYDRGRSSRGAPLLGLWVVLGLTACGDILEVKNPNNVTEEAVRRPEAAAALVNGALARVANGVDYSALVVGTAADEYEWTGSRDAWRELDEGKLSNGFNEFTDAAYPEIAQARWLADEAIRVLEGQQAEGTLPNKADLARAYLYSAIAYVSAADMWDDFTLPVKKGESVPPVGQANMKSLYDKAIEYLNKAEPLASGELKTTIVAMRARAKFNKAIWDLVGVRPINTGLATDTYGASADATAALATIPAPDWEFRFTWSAGTGSSWAGSWVNSRQEMRLGPTYVEPSPTAPTWLDNVVLLDPIDNVPAPAVDKIQKLFRTEGNFGGITVISARELHLILAEAALAAGNTAGFQAAINNLRALDGLSAWTPASSVTATALLIHSRQANLFRQGRRLADHYRFQIASAEWRTGAQAFEGGWFLPITANECLTNTTIGAENCSK